ncbi:histidine kinase [Streptosporangium sp. NPDC049078]|uniref:sensor histidine kinase n=1 Tax=Streptosporangium sp. NPDC049078 TaxID=3155767 RepID=UPI00343570BD
MRRLARLVPFAFSTHRVPAAPAVPAAPSGLSARRRRSSVQRLRRMTVFSLTMGLVLAWISPLAELANEDGGGRPSLLTVGIPGLVIFSLLYLRILRAALDGTGARGEIVASAVVAVALMLTQDGGPWSWGLLGPAWVSGAALLLGRSATIVAAVAATAAGLFLAWPGEGIAEVLAAPYEESSLPGIGAYLGVAAAAPWSNRFQLWFWQLFRAAEEGKEARARLAVTEERLRFSRDLHDLVGHSLSAIAVKSEVASKLSGVDAGRAAREMDEVRTLARQTLKEIRGVVRGYRTVDLTAELRAMTAVLEAGDIRCTLETPREQVPEGTATLLAWVVREGTTNVLRHSSATRCRITITLRGGDAVLEMTNDGVDEDGGGDGVDGRGGTGLLGLSERVAAIGGTVTAGPGGPGTFRLRATIPLEGER